MSKSIKPGLVAILCKVIVHIIFADKGVYSGYLSEDQGGLVVEGMGTGIYCASIMV